MRIGTRHLLGLALFFSIGNCAPAPPHVYSGAADTTLIRSNTKCPPSDTSSYAMSKEEITGAIREFCHNNDLTLTGQIPRRQVTYSFDLYPITDVQLSNILNAGQPGALTLSVEHTQGEAFSCEGSDAAKIQEKVCLDLFQMSLDNCDTGNAAVRRGGKTPYGCGINFEIKVNAEGVETEDAGDAETGDDLMEFVDWETMGGGSVEQLDGDISEIWQL